MTFTAEGTAIFFLRAFHGTWSSDRRESLCCFQSIYTPVSALPPVASPPQAPERVVHYVYSRDGVGNTDSLCLSVATSHRGTAGCATAGGVLGCADNVASDTTLQVCNENDDNQRFGLYRSGSHYILRSLLGDNQCLTVSQSTHHSACEPFTLAPCADSDRQKFIEEKVRRFDGVKIWRNVGTGLAIDVDSYANRVNQWIWACPGDNAAKYWRSTIPVAAPTPPPPPLAPERVVHYVYSRDGVGNTDSLCLSVATSRLGTAGCAIAGGVLGCADNVASDTTLQVCNENDDNQRFGLYR